jgi:rRNA processing protein Krr1/Pno1
MMFERYELIPEQEKILKQKSNDHPCKVKQSGAIQWTLERKTNNIQINQREKSNDESVKSIKAMTMTIAS